MTVLLSLQFFTYDGSLTVILSLQFVIFGSYLITPVLSFMAVLRQLSDRSSLSLMTVL
jgi:hypothetical protein